MNFNPRTASHSHAPFLAAIAFLIAAIPVSAQNGNWSFVPGTGAIIPREECSFAQAGGKFYLMGGRGLAEVQEFNPATRAWKNLAKPPVEMNHFQALSLHGLVYVIGAMHGAYPHEAPIAEIYIYDPLTDNWIKGMTIPTVRWRGSCGVATHAGKIYVALGIRDGHSSGWAPLLDEYDPATGAWTPLPDAPRARDHFQTAIAGGKLYALGGRRSNWKVDNVVNIFAELEKVDVYDIAAGTWSTLPVGSNHPLPRSGSVNTALGDDIIVAGGGSNSNGILAHKQTHALNTVTGQWRALDSLNTGRQVLGGVLNNGGIYLASGSGGSGGNPVLNTMEVFFLGDSTAPVGPALTAGQLSVAETSFNLGKADAGAKLTRVLQVKHQSGTQGVLISAAKFTGTGFAFKNAPAFPILAAPGAGVSLELEYASMGAGADGELELTLAVPKGATFKVALEANKKALGIAGGMAKASKAARAGQVGIRTYPKGDHQRDGNGRAVLIP